jgi:hypothetical protein
MSYPDTRWRKQVLHEPKRRDGAVIPEPHHVVRIAACRPRPGNTATVCRCYVPPRFTTAVPGDQALSVRLLISADLALNTDDLAASGQVHRRFPRSHGAFSVPAGEI